MLTNAYLEKTNYFYSPFGCHSKLNYRIIEMSIDVFLYVLSCVVHVVLQSLSQATSASSSILQKMLPKYLD